MTRTEHRSKIERAVIDALPVLDQEAKEAVYAAVTRSRYPNLAAYSKALAEVMRCRHGMIPIVAREPVGKFGLFMRFIRRWKA